MKASERAEARSLSRSMATRYSAGILTMRELSAWLAKHHDEIRTGHIKLDLIVTREAFDDLPGDDIKCSNNAQFESVFRKTGLVKGATVAQVEIRMIETIPDPRGA